MIFKITNGAVSFGDDTVLECVNFQIKDREKVAVVGRNGAGKTTLLKCVTGEVQMEEGTGEEPFSLVKVDCNSVGYLKQIAFERENATLIEEILSCFSAVLTVEEKMNKLQKELESDCSEKKIKEYSSLCEKYEFLGGYTYKKEYSTMLKKFGFTEQDKDKSICEFSGGQRTKIAFMKLLLSKPDILLLDEPTNHLDMEAIKWLEGYIKNYKSAVVIVSHDRMFIERTVDKIYEIEYGESKCYKGNYSQFEIQKKLNYQKQLKDYEYQREEIARLTRLIERFRYKATKAKMVQSKIKQIERMKIVNKPDRYDLESFHLNFEPRVESVKKALVCSDLSIGYFNELGKVNLELFRGDKLAVIGDNGVGKSTFVKTLVSEIEKLSGSFEFGLRSEIGYFNQQMAEYKSEKTVLEDFHDEYPRLTEFEVRSALGAFLFNGEDVFKVVNDLSGGERVRLALCKIFKKRPNFLILDEPTNHMDIVGKETLENMLLNFKGTVIFVSHDRYFVNKVANKLLVFEKNGVDFFPFNYAEYELTKSQEEEVVLEKSQAVKEKKTFTTPLKEKSKTERRLKKLSEMILEIESVIDKLNEELSLPEVYSDYTKVCDIQSKLEKAQKEYDEYFNEWVDLSDKIN